LSWIGLADVATAAVNSLEEPESENGIVPIAGERLSYRDVVAVFEEVTGRAIAVQQVPAEALAAQRDAAPDEREQSFAGLMLGVAAGSPPGDGETWLRRLGFECPLTVSEVPARYMNLLNLAQPL
jgi:uncharacterized protein YbjT (DUF2867 family)